MSMAKLVHPIPLYHTVSIHTLIHTVGIEFLAHRNVVQYHAVHCPLMRRQVRPHERPTENPSVSPTHTKCPCTRLRSPTVCWSILSTMMPMISIGSILQWMDIGRRPYHPSPEMSPMWFDLSTVVECRCYLHSNILCNVIESALSMAGRLYVDSHSHSPTGSSI